MGKDEERRERRREEGWRRGEGGMEGWYKIDNEEYNRSSQVIPNHTEAACVHY